MTSSGDATEDESSVGGIIIHNLPSLPAGVKFNPNDIEILDHLEAKVLANAHHKLHPLIDVFITTLEGEGGICYTHPEKLPGLSKDGQPGHFFHRLPKAHTAGRTRKIRRKVDSYTSWQKTGKTRPIVVNGTVKGFKKIFVLHTKNMNQIRKHEKTNWVMHQHHLGDDANEKDGEMVVSKVFYQMQARPCAPFKKRSALETIYFNDVFC